MAVNINLGGWTVKKNILRSGEGLNTVGLISNDDHTRISEGNWLGEDGFEYVTLEYLENRGGSYINLDIPFNPTKDGFKIVAKSFNTTETMMPFGSGSTDATNYRCWLYYYPHPYGTGNIDFYTQTKLNKSYGEVSLDKIEFTFDPDSTETDVDYPDMCLFNAYTKGYAFKGRIYSCIITKDGVVYRNLSPVRRYNANTEKFEYGMYDSISQSFFGDATNANDFTGPRKLSDIYSFYSEVDLMGGYTYRELDYIESTGQQFIDTGVTFAREDSLKVELDIDILDRATTSGWGQLFGVSVDASGTLTNSGYPFSLWIEHGISGSTLHKYIGATGHESTPMTFGRQKIVMEANSLAYGSNNPLYIFAIDYGGTPSYHKCPYKLYSCVIYKNGVKERDYIPVARTKTNSAPIYDYGVYDIIDSHRKFYRNIGYDDFIPGAVADVNSLLQKRTTYRRLEYIESEGIDYVDSGFKITSSTKVNAVVAAGAKNTGYRFLFGGWATLALGYNNNVWTACSGLKQNTSCGAVELDKKISVSLVNDEAWIDGEHYTLSTNGNENNYNFLIFGSSDFGHGPHSWDYPYHGTGRIYQLEVINDANGKDHLFIPVKRGDGKLGFYDSYQMEFLPIPDGAQGFSGHDLPVGTEFVSIYCGSSYPDQAPFRVTNRGNLYAENATISGNITATSGKIGDWLVDELNPTIPDGYKGIYKAPRRNGYGTGMAAKDNTAENVAFWAGYQGQENVPDDVTPWTGGSDWDERCSFYVTDKGNLVARNAKLYGLDIEGGTANINRLECRASVLKLVYLPDGQLYNGKRYMYFDDSSSETSVEVNVDYVSGSNHKIRIYVKSAVSNDIGCVVYYKYAFDSTYYSTYLTISAGSLESSPFEAKKAIPWFSFNNGGEAVHTTTKSFGSGDIFISLGGIKSKYYYDNVYVTPTNSNHTYLGHSSRPWSGIFTKNTSGSSSFRGIKKDIKILDDKNDILFDNLIPRTYKFIQNESDRTHYGFILDEVRSAMDKADISSKDFAPYILENIDDADGNGYLRYSEFIPLNTWQIQKLKSRCAELESKVESLIAQIEELKTKNE